MFGLKNLSIKYKLILLFAITALPLAYVSYEYLKNQNELLNYQRIYADSLNYYNPVTSLASNVATHRGLTGIYLSGDQSVRQRRLEVEFKIETNLRELEEQDRGAGKQFNLGSSVTSLKERWNQLKGRGTQMSTDESFDLHTKYIQEVQLLMKDLGDKALILDPNLDTYYLMINLLQYYPSSVETLGQMRVLGSSALTKGTISFEERVRLSSLAGSMSNLFGANGLVPLALKTSFGQNTVHEKRLNDTLSNTYSVVDGFQQFAKDRVVGDRLSGNNQEYFASATRAIEAVERLKKETVSLLQERTNERVSAYSTQRTVTLLVAGLAVLLMTGLTWFLGSSINTQVSHIVNVFGNIGMGNFSARAKVTSGDELGTVADGLNSMLEATLSLFQSQAERDQIQDSIQELVEQLEKVAAGDLTREVKASTEFTAPIVEAVNQMIYQLRNVISIVQETTKSVSEQALQAKTTTNNLAEGSGVQSAKIGDASQAVGTIAQSIEQVAQTAVTATQVAHTATSSAKAGSESVRKTIDGMDAIRNQVQQTAKRIKRLGESSQEVGGIVKLISDIAERTGVLALNASIQAVAAGEAGKTFAVVAKEVERLAVRATEATKRIESLISTIQTETSEAVVAMEETTREVVDGSELANEAGAKLADIEAVSGQLSSLIDSISSASKVQSVGSASVTKVMTEISEVTRITTSGSQETAATMQELAEQAEQLRQSLSAFKLPATVA
jgi:twitching motility protein PilJ